MRLPKILNIRRKDVEDEKFILTPKGLITAILLTGGVDNHNQVAGRIWKELKEMGVKQTGKPLNALVLEGGGEFIGIEKVEPLK
jgi:hypothetical protein